MAKKRATRSPRTSKKQPAQSSSDRRDSPGRELIVIAREEVGLRASATRVASITGYEVSPLEKILASADAALTPLFGETEDRLRAISAAMAAEPGAPPADLSVYYLVQAPEGRLDELAEQLADQEMIEAAYVKPAAEPAATADLNEMLPSTEDAPPVTPDFTARQIYLNAAPAGVDARFAWTVGGGSGAGIRIIDIEGAWRFTHEDLLQNHGGVIGGTQSADIGWRNHGTAVIGEFGGDRNNFGVTGICPDANTRAISIFGLGSAAAIRQAAMALSPGDIILIELHRPGPRFNFQSRPDQRGFIAIEWWPDDFAAIQFATQRGVIVVEAAGNGAENLDDAIYSQRPTGFPANWTNPFNRNNRDSGAIMVGAGAPPPGTHGRDHGPDRSRLDFSNYGALLDAQGWGREVTTCGYGDLQGGANEDLWYTDRFSGTSSASPIVVGAVGCVQGILRARNQPRHTPAQMRALLRSTGSPQTDAPARPRTQRIANRPNLREMIQRLTGGGGGAQIRLAALYRYWNPAIGDHFYTTNFAELGQGRHGWHLEGIQCYVFPTRHVSTVPLYRYWNPGIGDHFYTTNFNELGQGRHGWRLEGIQCYVQPRRASGSLPLYRYWNPSIGDHFYTTNFNELGQGRHGWRLEGVQCYVYPQQLVSLPSAPEVESTSSVPDTFSVEVDEVAAIAMLPQGYDGEDSNDVPELTDVVDVGAVPGSFTTTEIDSGIRNSSFEMLGSSGADVGQGFGPASFQTETPASTGEVSIHVNVNKKN